MYFHFTIKKSYSQNRHLCRTRLTEWIKPVMNKESSALFEYMTDLFTGIDLKYLIEDPPFNRTRIMQPNNYVFQIIAIKNNVEACSVTYYCFMRGTKLGLLAQKLIASNVPLYIEIDYHGALTPIYTLGKKKFTMGFGMEFTLVVPSATMNFDAIPLITVCDDSFKKDPAVIRITKEYVAHEDDSIWTVTGA